MTACFVINTTMYCGFIHSQAVVMTNKMLNYNIAMTAYIGNNPIIYNIEFINAHKMMKKIENKSNLRKSILDIFKLSILENLRILFKITFFLPLVIIML